MSTGEGLAVVGLVAAATALIITGNGIWVIGLVALGALLLT